MSATQKQVLTVNGFNYDLDMLSPDGQKLVSLLAEAQRELTRLDIHKELLLASQQQLTNLLKPLLPEPLPRPNDMASIVTGKVSRTIPTTPAIKPTEQPAPFPDTLPNEIRSQN